MEQTHSFSDKLRKFLTANNVWHRFIEFDEPVRTAEQAARQVPVAKIAKSIVIIDSNGEALLAILPATDRISLRKIKLIFGVRDARLASPAEVLLHSGYPAGGVNPFNDIKRTVLDVRVLKNETIIVGGGDVDKLVEIRTEDVVQFLKPRVDDVCRPETSSVRNMISSTR